VKRARSESRSGSSGSSSRSGSSSSSSSSSASSARSSSSDSDRYRRRKLSAADYDDPDDMPLFLQATQSGAVNLTEEQIAELTAEAAPTATGPPPRPKLLLMKRSIAAQLESAKTALGKAVVDATIKDHNKTLSLGTSKTNYIDPRIVYSWAAKYEVNASKVFSKSLQDKFPWAKEARDYEF
jgi:DNA topoisomerase-1